MKMLNVMNKKRLMCILALAGTLGIFTPVVTAAPNGNAGEGISPIVIGDFQDGTNQGWEWSGAGAAVTVEPNAGPSGYGDYALHAQNEQYYDRKLNPQNETPAATGDYLSLGVQQVTFSAMNPSSNDDDLDLHVVLYSGTGDWPYMERWVSLNSASVPNDGVWRTYTISVLESDMTRVMGTYDYETQLSNITMISLRHQESPYQSGGSSLSSTNNSVLLDNISLGVEDIPGLGRTGSSRQLELTFSGEVSPVPDWRWKDAFGRVTIKPSFSSDNPSWEGQPEIPVGFEFDIQKLSSLDTFGYLNDYDGRNAYAIYMWTEAYGRTRIKTFQSQFKSETFSDTRWLWGFSDKRLLTEDMCVEVWVERDDGIDAPDMLSYTDGNWSFPVLRAESAEGVCSSLKN